MNVWTLFWKWYQVHVLKAFYVNFAIIVSQIPHMIWNGDAFLLNGTIGIFQIHPVLDFIFYGIDLIEIPLIINTVFEFFAVRNLITRKNT